MRTWIGVRRLVVCMAIGLLAVTIPAASGPAFAQSAGPTATVPSVPAGVVTLSLAGGGSTINGGGTSDQLKALRCGDQMPVAGEDSQTINCSKPVLFVPGYSFDGTERHCTTYFAGALEEYASWGYHSHQLVTVGIYHSDRQCNLAVGDYGLSVMADPGSGVPAQINIHAWAGGTPENHEWVTNPECGFQPEPTTQQAWLFSPSSCWGHNKNTPIEHLAYHFGHMLEQFGPVDIVAHSLGGLVVQAAHSYSVREQGRPNSIRRPFRSVAQAYDDVVTSGTPFGGIAAANTVAIDIPGLGSLPLDICSTRASADGRPDRINPGQCRQLRAGSPFMRAMQANMTSDSGGGRWSVIGSNAYETNTDLPISYTSAIAHPTNRRYVYDRWATSLPPTLPLYVTHANVPLLPQSVYYYSYVEQPCAGMSWRLVQAMSASGTPTTKLVYWPNCWDAGLFKHERGFVYDGNLLCENPASFPPGRAAELYNYHWCHDVISPRHNRLAFLASTTNAW